MLRPDACLRLLSKIVCRRGAKRDRTSSSLPGIGGNGREAQPLAVSHRDDHDPSHEDTDTRGDPPLDLKVTSADMLHEARSHLSIA